MVNTVSFGIIPIDIIIGNTIIVSVITHPYYITGLWFMIFI